MFLYVGEDKFEDLCGAEGEACDLDEIENNIADEVELLDYFHETCPTLKDVIKKIIREVKVYNIDYEDGTSGYIKVIIYSDIKLSESQLNLLNEAIADFDDDYFSIYTNIEFKYDHEEKM